MALDFHAIAAAANTAADAARAETLPRFRRVGFETKSDGSPVTEADKAAVYSARWKYIESYQPHEGHQDRELHALGSRENGAANNRLIGEQAVARRLTALLESWKGDVPRVATTHARRPISSQEIEQLRALGYID